MTLYLVRHAHAGDRAAWTGDDRRRPLSARGRTQAESIALQVADVPLTRILSSPARRCLDTVEPLATLRELVVEEDDALAEGAPFDIIDRLLRRCGDQDALLCSHGDVIGAIVTTVRRRGVPVGREPRWPLGSTWRIEGWPDTDHAEFLPTPAAD
ncbi:MAG: histidine phosphatase family protein [Nitriliruptoraceae bacterium]|nr:histidine phosphatase family protein [Nitriliruptoraceae bacterium]